MMDILRQGIAEKKRRKKGEERILGKCMGNQINHERCEDVAENICNMISCRIEFPEMIVKSV